MASLLRLLCANVLIALALSACDAPSKPDSAAPAPVDANVGWDAHIDDYPRRWVAAEAPLKIRFSHPVAETKDLNRPQAGLIDINPSIPLVVIFSAENEITLTPQQRLPADQPFSFNVHPGKLLGVDKVLSPFRFDVHTLKQAFDLRVDGLAVQADKPGMMYLKGELITSDTAELAQVRQLLNVEVNGERVEPTWTQDNNRKRNQFVLENIERGKTAGLVRLHWDGAPLGVADKGARELPLPALAEFGIAGVRVQHQPETYIEVNFSAPLNRQQNLAGLVSLDRQSPRLRLDGSSLRIYPTEVSDKPVELQVSSLVQSASGQTLGADYHQSLLLALVLPSVNFVGREAGILPPAARLSVPFEAAGVDSVQVVAFKIYDNNVGQYLQRNRLQTSYADQAVGRYLWRKVYPLPELPRTGKQRFNLDLTELMAQHPEGLLRLELRIDRSNTIVDCPGERPASSRADDLQNHEGEDYYSRESDPDWYRQYYQSAGYYNYSERKNPCADAYYYFGDQHTASRTFMVSDIGLLAKRGQDNRLLVVATRLDNANPLPQARIKVYNFQQQVIGQGTTDNYGMLELDTEGTPFYLVAEHQKSRGYLRLPRNEALPTNAFDVSGEHVKEGLKGFIYGERDVWRPGDDIHLTFVLQDRENRIPAGHPVRLDLFDPRGTKQANITQVQPVNDFYTFQLKTAEDAPTGNWRAVVHLGNRYFDKIIKVETITPNRLKLELTPDSLPLRTDQPQSIGIFSQWLHGASASGLKADSELRLLARKTRFEGFDHYLFDDPIRRLDTAGQKVFEGQLDAEGRARFDLQIPLAEPPAGMLTALFTSRVFEPGGNFSTALRGFEVHPFTHWVGLQVPKGDGYYDAISRDQDHPVHFQTLGPEGKPAAARELEVSVYALAWRWWWDQSGEDLASFVGSEQHLPVASARLTSDAQGKVNWTLAKNTYDWGRHLIRVCDTQSRHCAGQMVYLGWSWGQQQNQEMATQLMLTTDKERYAVGDSARVRLPRASQGRVLLSLENGSRILERRWVDVAGNEPELVIPITEAMAPNAYVHLTLLLPHQQRDSDAPMRLYGIVPLLVEDPATRLQPLLKVPEEVRPETEFTLSVSETHGKAMTYTLAVVDEGLLGLTGFKVPDAHGHFYRREALGVNTWDLFDQVVGAYGASLERVLAIGGSDADQEDERNRRERRFPPVVKFLGAFTLKPGETREHTVILPPYMGAVRAMLVAGDGSKTPAYGKAEASITVTQPLVLLATLPRVLGPGEEVSLPVNVFVSDAAIREVEISVETNEIFTAIEPSARLGFTQPGDAIGHLKLRVNDQLGKGWVKVTARSGDEVATQEIYIDSRAANPPSLVQQSYSLAPGETWTSSLEPHGLAGTNTASLEVSSLPPLNLERRLDYLLRYPHGCLEQLTSAAFPQLYLGRLLELNDTQKADIDSHINTAIRRLRSLQQANGGFSYWPGEGFINDWASSYAGHFLLEARRAGYAQPASLLDNWVSYQRQLARRTASNRPESQPLVAAYRLYTLALADQAELPAMNRLREQLRADPRQPASARWVLAMTYQHLGLKDVADELLGRVTSGLAESVPEYDQPDYTYGSNLRDRSLLLMTLVKANQGNSDLAWQQAELIASELASDNWYATQTTAWALLAMSDLAAARNTGSPMVFALQQAEGAWESLQSGHSLYRQPLESTRISLRNEGEQTLRLMVSNRGLPANLQETESAHGLTMDIQFLDLQNRPLDVQRLPQGTDFVAEVTISADFARLPGQGISDLAATLVVPGGWQIRNERLEDAAAPKGVDYLDIRDDRVLAYFSLWRDNPWSYRYRDRHQTSVTLRFLLNASYAGRFYLPGWQTSAMYDERIQARSRGFWVEVE